MAVQGQRAKRTPKAEPDYLKRKKWLKIRMNDDELQGMKRVADQRGLTVAELVRSVLNKGVKE